MKLQGFVGSGSGRLGASVFVVRNGQQIVRQYQGKVSDAKSAMQVEQRAKLKLSSQVASVIAPYLGISRIGLSSPRNLFVKKMFADSAFSYDEQNSRAEMDLTKLALTTGAQSALTGLSATATGSTVTVHGVFDGAWANGNRVVVAVVVRPAVAGGIIVIGSASNAVTSSEVTMTVTAGHTITTNDRVLVYTIKVGDGDVWYRYLNMSADLSNPTEVFLRIVRTQGVAKGSEIFSITNNMAISIS